MTDINCEVLVLGGGPGGYGAAFRAADLGKKVTLVERYDVLGGVCLNVGCIPSKSLLHIAHTISEAAAASAYGIDYPQPKIDLAKIGKWKNSVSKTLQTGLAGLAKQRGVSVVVGTGKFTSSTSLQVTGKKSTQTLTFQQAIIAAGSQPTRIPTFPNDDPRLWDSTDALQLSSVPKKLLIVGGGIIGLEMATVYHALGSEVSVVELQGQIIPGCDADLVRPLYNRIKKQYANIWLETKVAEITALKKGLQVTFDGKADIAKQTFDAVLVAVGRTPNGANIAADQAGITVDQRGFIPVDNQQKTNVGHIFAIGDIVGNPMLAHKAAHEGKVAAEVIAGHKSCFDALTIPAVAYTDPEIAWMGLTETQAAQDGVAFDKAVFPWAANGRSLSLGRKEGYTKVLCEKKSGKILGAGITGTNAGELLAEAVLALEMGADAEDVGLSIHPHPSLSETFGLACEMISGTITDLYIKRP